MMNLRDAVAECLLERFERQRLIQVLTDLPSFDHSGENTHEEREVDETSIETHTGNICHPDLILMRDVKVFKQVAPRLIPLKRSCGSTRTLDADQQILVFHLAVRSVGFVVIKILDILYPFGYNTLWITKG